MPQIVPVVILPGAVPSPPVIPSSWAAVAIWLEDEEVLLANIAKSAAHSAPSPWSSRPEVILCQVPATLAKSMGVVLPLPMFKAPATAPRSIKPIAAPKAPASPSLPSIAPKAPHASSAASSSSTAPSSPRSNAASAEDKEDRKVKHPGTRGGHGYYDDKGEWQYGTRPAPTVGVTAFPEGKDQPGIALGLRESAIHEGTYHVVSGPAKLRMLRVATVKQGEKYEQEKERRKAARKEKEFQKRYAEEQRVKAMPKKDKEAYKEQKATEKEQKKIQAKAKERSKGEAAQKVAETMADALGWDKKELDFDEQRKVLASKGYSEKDIEKYQARHDRLVQSKVKEAYKAIVAEVTRDPALRKDAGLENLPLQGDGEEPGYQDLFPTSMNSPLGYSLKDEADRKVEAQAAMANSIDETKERLEATEDPETAKQLQAELDAAVAAAEGLAKDPKVLQAEIEDADEAIRDAQNAKLDLMEQGRSAVVSTGDAKAEIPPEIAKRIEEADAAVTEAITAKKKLDVQAAACEALIDQEATGIKESRKQRMDPVARKAVEKAQKALKETRDKVSAAKKAGHVKDPAIAVDPKKLDAMKTKDAIKAYIAYNKALKATKGSAKAEDPNVYRAYVIEAEAVTDEAVLKQIQDDVGTDLAKAFLTKVETVNGIVPDPTEARAALTGHLAQGSFDAFQEASQGLFNQSSISKEACDILGVQGAAELLAWHLHNNETKENVKGIADQVGKYHAETQSKHMTEAMKKADELQAEAETMRLGEASSPMDLKVAEKAHGERMKNLKGAAKELGQCLGRLEAQAGLSMALGKKAVKQIQVSLGALSPEIAVRQARALGLQAGDYQIHSDGTNQFLTLKESGFSKIVKPHDQKALDDLRAVRDIKTGKKDEKPWLPKGFAVRKKADIDAADWQGLPPSYAKTLEQCHKDNNGDWHETVKDFISSQYKDGWSADRIFTELNNIRTASTVKGMGEHHVSNFIGARNEFLPTKDEHGNHRQTESYKKEIDAIAKEHAEKSGGEVGGIHLQRLVDDQGTVEALHRALAEFPGGKHAFQSSDELDSQGAKALREYFEENIGGKLQPGAKKKYKAAVEAWNTKNPAPEMYTKKEASLFGLDDEDESAPLLSQEYQDWVHRKHSALEALRAEHLTVEGPGAEAEEQAKEDPNDPNVIAKRKLESPQDRRKREEEEEDAEAIGATHVDWEHYVAVMGSVPKARAAVQDRMKNDLLSRFHKHYQNIHKTPLMASRDKIAHSDRSAAATDPRIQKKLRRQEGQVQASLQGKNHLGHWLSGEVTNLAAAKAQPRARKEQTMDLFGGSMDEETEKKAQTEVLGNERLTLGRQAEGQVAEMLQRIGHAYKAGHKLDLVPARMHAEAGDSVPYHLQQRAVKFGTLRKRCGIHGGVGSGKTNIAFGIFSEAHAKGEVKRGVFCVPSVVKGQFGQEAATFLDPGKHKWFADTGASKEKRFSAYKDPSTHMMVVTHQGFRDDALKMLGAHWNDKDEASVSARVMGMSPKELLPHLRGAFKGAGAEDLLDAFMMDEGHHSLNREGKADSVFARIVDTISHHAEDADKYFVSATGTPVKNDLSEVYDELHKVAPSKYPSRDEFLRKYDSGTSATAGALKREIDPHFYSFQVPSGTTPKKVIYGQTPGKPAVKLTDWQKGEIGRVDELYAKASKSARRGEVDHEALAALLGKPIKDEAQGKRFNRVLAQIRDMAHKRTIENAPWEHNAKIQECVKLANGFKQQGRGGVVFERSNLAREEIKKALESHGHKVIEISGSDSSQEKDDKRRAYLEGHYDIALCSDACNAGVSLHKSKKQGHGSWMVAMDVPDTYANQEQRFARINRIGQKFKDVDLIQLAADHPLEEAATQRVKMKKEFHDMVMSDSERLDDTGLGHAINLGRQAHSEYDIGSGAGLRDEADRAEEPAEQKAA